jgi:hypothetical protein
MISAITVVLGGLLVTMWVGLFVKPFIEHLRLEIPIPSISDDLETEAKWQRLVGKGDKSGMWVGRLERLILFGALLLGAKEAASVIGVWLAFKLAAKWEAWNHMSHVPDSIKDVDDLRYAYARRIWAAHGYGTLVLGTGANFLAAGVGAVLTRFGLAWLRCQGM